MRDRRGIVKRDVAALRRSRSRPHRAAARRRGCRRKRRQTRPDGRCRRARLDGGAWLRSTLLLVHDRPAADWALDACRAGRRGGTFSAGGASTAPVGTGFVTGVIEPAGGNGIRTMPQSKPTTESGKPMAGAPPRTPNEAASAAHSSRSRRLINHQQRWRS